MWTKGWRDRVWSELDTHWDIIVIGGGITGAGILREATRTGFRTLLVEAHDFASGTSSRSSKLVHGGFRYLRNVQLKLTYESVHERERLLIEGKGLVSKLAFLMPSYDKDRITPWVMGVGLAAYSLLALKWNHRRYNPTDMLKLCPQLNETGLRDGYRFFDAQTDDARLVLRVIQEAVAEGGLALNYANASGLLRNKHGKVCGVILTDEAPEGSSRTIEIEASVVINATGAWADELRDKIGHYPRLRKLRGSHLIFPYNRLPLARAVSIFHPKDGRPVFAFPWEGVIILGTTDVDHQSPLQTDIGISLAEAEYLLLAAQDTFPVQELSMADVQTTFSGLRPVVDTGKSDPSKESREHVLWNESGLLTVTGGKLTTFRLMAYQALKAASNYLSASPKIDNKARILNTPPADEIVQADINPALRLRIQGRYGNNAPALINAAKPGELAQIDDSIALWGELRWAARAEGVVHLDDLLLRRVRLGLLLPQGGLPLMGRVRTIVQNDLGWDDIRWEKETKRYTKLWKRYHKLNTDSAMA